MFCAVSDATAQYLTVPRTARYYEIGNPQADELWIVLHGYGQLAQYFIRHFQMADDGSRWIVAPEALSRFYLDAAYNRVGASWMTREDRHLEIQDQHAYLDLLYQSLLARRRTPLKRLVVLGFSQGATTAWRWVLQQQVPFDALVVWGGSIPSETVPAAAFVDRILILAYGDSDKLVTPERMTDIRQTLISNLIPVVELPYTGGHTIPPDALQRLVDLLAG